MYVITDLEHAAHIDAYYRYLIGEFNASQDDEFAHFDDHDFWSL